MRSSEWLPFGYKSIWFQLTTAMLDVEDAPEENP